jgi:folate-binding protein YgfZ
LRKYVLRSKVAIEDVSAQIAVSGVDAGALAAADFGAAPAAAEYREQDGVGVAAVRRDGAPERYWMVGDAAAIPSSDNVQADTVERAWRLGDIREGSPQVYAATSELFVAQMLNLDLIGGISFDKGCYTGQEIIARTQHLGRIKRRMSRLRLPPGSWSIGQPLRLEDGRTGRLTEVAPSAEGFEALAVLSLDPGSADGEGGAERALAAEELPLPYRTG